MNNLIYFKKQSPIFYIGLIFII